MKRMLNYITIIMFFTIVGMFAVSTIIYHRSSGETVAVSPDDTYADVVETYVSQSFPMQNTWTGFRNNVLSVLGKTEIDGSYIVNDGIIVPLSSPDSAVTDSAISEINDFAKTNADISTFAMVVPTASGVYSAELPAFALNVDQRHYIDDIYYKLDKSIVTLDAYYPLFSARDEYIYNRTDSRWTSLGAFYTYSSVIRKMGFVPNTISDYDIEHASREYYGSLYEKLDCNGISLDHVDLFIPKWGTVVTSVDCYKNGEKTTYKSVYNRSATLTENPLDVYLYGNEYDYQTVKTIVDEGPSLLVVKGSYGNAILPFIVSHYSKITVVDVTTLGDTPLSDIVNLNNYDQALFLFSLDEFTQSNQLNNVNK